jgi:hypothetical protein
MLVTRKFIAAALLCASCANALAANAPLPAGKPAGTKEAALAGSGFVILLGLAGVAALTAIMVSQDHNNGVTTPTTTSTSGTGA